MYAFHSVPSIISALIQTRSSNWVTERWRSCLNIDWTHGVPIWIETQTGSFQCLQSRAIFQVKWCRNKSGVASFSGWGEITQNPFPRFDFIWNFFDALSETAPEARTTWPHDHFMPKVLAMRNVSSVVLILRDLSQEKCECLLVGNSSHQRTEQFWASRPSEWPISSELSECDLVLGMSCGWLTRSWSCHAVVQNPFAVITSIACHNIYSSFIKALWCGLSGSGWSSRGLTACPAVEPFVQQVLSTSSQSRQELERQAFLAGESVLGLRFSDCDHADRRPGWENYWSQHCLGTCSTACA